MAIINLRNGLRGHDYTATMIREAPGYCEFSDRLGAMRATIERDLERSICDEVIATLPDDVPFTEFIAAYLDHPRAEDVVVG